MIYLFMIFFLIFLVIKSTLLNLKYFKQLLCENDYIMIISWSNRINFFYNNLIILLNIISIQILINRWFLDNINYYTDNIIIFDKTRWSFFFEWRTFFFHILLLMRAVRVLWNESDSLKSDASDYSDCKKLTESDIKALNLLFICTDCKD